MQLCKNALMLHSCMVQTICLQLMEGLMRLLDPLTLAKISLDISHDLYNI